MSDSAVLIVNTKSRTGRDQFAAAQRALKAKGVSLQESLALRDPRWTPDAVEKAIAGGATRVIVGGGDGTLSGVLPCFVRRSCVLGVLPLGTGNEFARDLGIAADIETACDVIANGKIAEIDLGVVNEKYFLNVATIGLTTQIAQELTPEAKRRFGKLVYGFALARALVRVHPFHMTLKTAEQNWHMQTLQVVIGNGRFHAGPFPLAPDASITDGKLIVYALTNASKWNLLRYALNLPGGHHVELPCVEAASTTGGEITTAPLQRVTVDGEIVLRTPLTFRIAPKAIHVMVPQSFA